MSCPQEKPCKSKSSFPFREYLHKARDACHWVGHLNDPPSPTEEFDDWLMAANSGDPQSPICCGVDSVGSGGGSQTCPFVDVFLYMVLKSRQAAAAMAVIMLSAIVIALRSAQFISGRWSQTFGVKCSKSGVLRMFCFQATTLCALNLFVLFTVYWPAYYAFLSITGVMAWVITALKATVLSIIVFLP